jgi:hypothetical protein
MKIDIISIINCALRSCPDPAQPIGWAFLCALAGLSSTGLSSTGLSSTGLSSTGLSSTGLSSTGLSSTGLSSTGLSSTGPVKLAGPRRAILGPMYLARWAGSMMRGPRCIGRCNMAKQNGAGFAKMQSYWEELGPRPAVHGSRGP